MQGFQVFFEIPGKPPVELRDGESIIGRSRQATVHIPETTVSRQHAKVVVGAAGKVSISDLGSSNGTFVNGDRIAGDRKLADGDRVLVGDAELTIRILAPIEASDATVRVTIPPLTAPPPGPIPTGPAEPVTPAAPLAVPAPPPPRPAPAPAYDRPIDPPLRPEVPAPRPATLAPPPLPPSPQPLRPAPPPPAPAAAPPAGPPASREVLGSIEDIEKMPVPPGKRASSATGPLPARAAATATALRPAGFWIRVLAYLIDMVPMMLVAGIAFALTLFVDPTIGMLVNLLILPYWFLIILWMPATKGNSIGKKMLGLAIVTDQTRPGQGLGWGKAFLRLLGHFASSLVFSIGYLLVAFTSRKQGLHDMIAGTYVVRTR